MSPLTFGQEDTSAGFTDKIIAFEIHWNKFIRSYFGCPLTGETTKDNCKPSARQIDYAAFTKAQKAARKLFSE